MKAQLLRGGIGSLAVKAGHAVLAFSVAVVLARTLGPEGYGVYSFALAMLMFTAMPAQVGVPQLLVRETAKAQANGNYGLMRGLWRWGNLAVALFSAVGLVVVGGIVWFTDIGGDGARVATLAIGVALIPIIALAKVRGACLRGLRKVVQGQLPETIIRPALLLFLVLVWGTWFIEDELTSQMAMGFYVIAAVLAFVIGAWLLRRSRPAELGERPAPEYQSSAWRKAVIPLAMITGLQMINNHADLIIIGIFRPDQEVGVYRVVSQIALLSYFGFQAMNQVLQPHFSRLHNNESTRDKVRWIIKFSSRLVFFFSAPLFLIYGFFGAQIIQFFFGEAYTAGYIALVVLSAGLVFKSFYGVMATALNMAGHERTVFFWVSMSVILNIVFNMALVPTLGMNGAAISTAVSFLVLGSTLQIIGMRVFHDHKS